MIIQNLVAYTHRLVKKMDSQFRERDEEPFTLADAARLAREFQRRDVRHTDTFSITCHVIDFLVYERETDTRTAYGK